MTTTISFWVMLWVIKSCFSVQLLLLSTGECLCVEWVKLKEKLLWHDLAVSCPVYHLRVVYISLKAQVSLVLYCVSGSRSVLRLPQHQHCHHWGIGSCIIINCFKRQITWLAQQSHCELSWGLSLAPIVAMETNRRMFIWWSVQWSEWVNLRSS